MVVLQLHSYCVLHGRDERRDQLGSQRVWIKFQRILHYLGLYVNYKGTLGLHWLFTCLLRVSAKSLKDNNINTMFMIVLRRSSEEALLGWQVDLLHLGALLLRSISEQCPYFIKKITRSICAEWLSERCWAFLITVYSCLWVEGKTWTYLSVFFPQYWLFFFFSPCPDISKTIKWIGIEAFIVPWGWTLADPWPFTQRHLKVDVWGFTSNVPTSTGWIAININVHLNFHDFSVLLTSYIRSEFKYLKCVGLWPKHAE